MTFDRNAFVQYLLARLTERNTWIALISFASAIGVLTISDTLRDQIISIGVMLASGLVVATKEPPK